MHRPTIWFFLGYYGLIYLFIMALITVGYPLAQEYARPIAMLIFPEYTNASLLKALVVVTMMYWAMVGASLWWSTQTQKNPPQ